MALDWEFIKWFLPLLISSGVLGGAFALFKKTMSIINVIKGSMQALLRAQMISEYNKAKDKGYAPIYAKQNFENMWKYYHALGVNGVMDGIKDNYLSMPDEEEEVRNEH